MFNFFRKKKKPKTASFNADKFDWLLNESPLLFQFSDVFSHYFDSNTTKNQQDPAWQNQAIYFWDEAETFERKSLPDTFLDYEKKLFIINKIPEYITVAGGKAIPWFGKPGGANKYFFQYNNNAISIEEANELKVISYIKIITLQQENLHILNERNHYRFLVNSDKISFKEKEIYFEETKSSIAALYQQGYLKIIELI